MGTVTLDDGRSFTVDDSFGKLPLERQQQIIGELKQQLTSGVTSDIKKGQTVSGTAPVKDDLAYRASILPLGRTQEGKIVPALPQALYEAANITKQLMTGQKTDVTPPEALGMAAIGLGATPAIKGAAGSLSAIRGLSALEKPEIPESTAALKSASQALYKQTEAAGVRINPEAFRGMVSDIIPEVRKAGFDVDIQPKAAAALKRLAAEVGSGASPTLSNLDILRQVAGAASKSTDANERRIARIITGAMDDFMDNLKPSDVSGGDTKTAIASLKSARELWSRYAKSDQIDQMFEKAANRAPGTPALGYEGQLRNQFKALADNPNRMRRFSKDEQDAIKEVARGGNVQKAMTQLGKLSPNAGFFSMILSGGIGAHALETMDPKYLAIPAIGAMARYGASKMRESAANRLSEMVRGGKSAASFFKRRSELRRGLLGGESVFSP